ncbi:ATP-binding protein [Azospirillum sp. TSO22-1]|uniref:sensor histidine kinase n=1 Tax=Azospirillum sp. TSO22-1 TaxID=716789 RepID=UPI000D605BAA|nr:ATP-binding protein [Azospirillum sp. TSO22-1]PWC43453.1 histidine kinase [Azospirillum sp. TSO22-1]
MNFNLFDAEEQVIERAQALEARLTALAPEVGAELAELVDGFKRSYREQRRLVRVSDRLQGQLATANQEAERRRREAEDALERLREAQDVLVQQEKLASLGALVAGVAHEINTPVGIAVSCASHLSDATARLTAMVEKGELGRGDFNRYLATATDTTALILANCERAAQLINSFKQVAVDRASAERRGFDLRAYVQETLLSLQPNLKRGNHTVTVDCPPGLMVEGYPGALSQILTNLVMNSLTHGYGDGRAGRLRIAVTQPDPETVCLTYADDGAGIPPGNLPHVFEPFFTTRRGEGGSGLGLHIVHNLAVGPLKGSITVESPPGQGAAFALTFPRVAPG